MKKIKLWVLYGIAGLMSLYMLGSAVFSSDTATPEVKAALTAEEDVVFGTLENDPVLVPSTIEAPSPIVEVAPTPIASAPVATDEKPPTNKAKVVQFTLSERAKANLANLEMIYESEVNTALIKAQTEEALAQKHLASLRGEKEDASSPRQASEQTTSPAFIDTFAVKSIVISPAGKKAWIAVSSLHGEDAVPVAVGAKIKGIVVSDIRKDSVTFLENGKPVTKFIQARVKGFEGG